MAKLKDRHGRLRAVSGKTLCLLNYMRDICKSYIKLKVVFVSTIVAIMFVNHIKTKEIVKF